MTHPPPNEVMFLFSSCEQSAAKSLQNSNILQWNTKKYTLNQQVWQSETVKLSKPFRDTYEIIHYMEKFFSMSFFYGF